MKQFCQERGCKVTMGKHRISWGENGSLVWAEMNGKISLLLFANEEMIRNAKARAEVNSSAAVGANQRDAK